MTNRDGLIFVATNDIAGKTRGKAFPAAKLEGRLARGIGWTPTNVMITCFDSISEGPFGALGDLVLVPDEEAGFDVQVRGDRPRERVMLGDIRELDGAPWSCCTRSILKAAIARLERVAQLRVVAAFEHEFQFRTAPLGLGHAFGYEGFAVRREFGEALGAALQSAGIAADSFMKEFGPDQYEVTIEPASALQAADSAVVLREMARLVARAFGEEVTFTPIRDPASVGNGVHVHLSLTDLQGNPRTWSPDSPTGLSDVAGAFAAGILQHLPDLIALTAPTDISHLRLTPHRWSAAYNNLGLRDREAAVRICPYTASEPDAIARQFNFEYRAADAASSPYLVLAALMHAGAQGIEDGLGLPDATQEDISLLSETQLAEKGLTRLPQSLDEALRRFQNAPLPRRWFGETFCEVLIAHKRGELAELEGKSVEDRCKAYESVY